MLLCCFVVYFGFVCFTQFSKSIPYPFFQASESTDQLAYLWQSDSSPLVQNKAKEALLSLGRFYSTHFK